MDYKAVFKEKLGKLLFLEINWEGFKRSTSIPEAVKLKTKDLYLPISSKYITSNVEDELKIKNLPIYYFIEGMLMALGADSNLSYSEDYIIILNNLGDFLDKIIEYMLSEDEGFGDVTSNAVVEEGKIVKAYIKSKDEGILAGIDVIRDLFEEYGVNVLFWLKDGTKISNNDVLISLKGDARTILLLERTALNLLMRMSGVATAACHYADIVKDFDVRVAGTRKTSPAIGKFDKYALKVGGADPHRFGLDDMILIKDNHIATCKSPLDALLKAKENTSFSKKIEIEVETLEDAIDCVKNGADIVMLDNMGPDEVKEVIEELEALNIRKNSLIEVSGGITHETILDYASLGVDIISIGALTHSSRSLNFSLKIEES